MKTLITYSAVAGAGALGAVLRLFVGAVCGRFFGTSFPVGTLVINLSGSFFLGWFIAVRARGAVISDTVYAAIAVGFVGAYTTFSTFMYESNALLASGSGIKAMLNLIGSLVLGLLAVKAGVWLAAR